MLRSFNIHDDLYTETKNKLKKKKISFNEFIIRCSILYSNNNEFNEIFEKNIWEYAEQLYKNNKYKD